MANRGSRRKKKDLTLDESNVYITLVLAGKEIPCLLDSGCEATMVPRSMLTHRQIVNMIPTIRKVYAANDTSIQVEGELQLPFFLGEQCIWTDAVCRTHSATLEAPRCENLCSKYDQNPS